MPTRPIISVKRRIDCNMKNTLSAPPVSQSVFDEQISRLDTDSLKWDKYGDKDVIPMWVADMDFAIAEPIQQALVKRIAHPVFGYTSASNDLRNAIVAHIRSEYDWTIDADWLVFLPGVVTGLAVGCRAFCKDDDQIMVNPPIYHHFYDSHEGKRQSLVKVPLHKEAGRWTYDIARMQAAIKPDMTMIMMCSPHNPTGTVFTADELKAVGDMCAKNDMTIVSDEIHCDLVIDGQSRHIPTAAACPEHADRIITLMSASKTWNLAGLNTSFAIISDPQRRKQFVDACQSIVPGTAPLALVATEAAYTQGGEWRQALLVYLKSNYDLIERELETIPGLTLEPLQATYLAWIDATELGLKNTQAYFEDHGVGLSSGEQFGQPNYVRLNFACSVSVLEAGLARIRAAVAALKR